MKKLPLSDLLKHTEGRLYSGPANLFLDHYVTSFSSLDDGALLFDLHHGDHPAKPDCRCAIVTRHPEAFAGASPETAIIEVRDVRKAAMRFASFYRRLFKLPIVGVTGTCGKTTTKEMIRHILGQKLRVHATYKSYNAQFRHLNYLFEIDDTTQAGVYEMGVAYPGDLKVCCDIFRPTVGVITTIGIDHLQAFDTLDDYIRAKGEMLEGLGNRGTLVINGDDKNIKKIDFSHYRGKIITFGTGTDADYRVSDVCTVDEGLEYTLSLGKENGRFLLPLYGEFNAMNAAAAVAAAGAVGVPFREAAESLSFFHNVEKHCEVQKGLAGCTVIDDTWSTNPTSAQAALRLLTTLAHGRKRVAALGKMSLLGRKSEKYHLELGAQAARAGVDKLVVIGEEAYDIGHGALHEGMPAENVLFCKTLAQAHDTLLPLLDKETVVLVKTSMLSSYGRLADSILAKRDEP